MNPTFVSHFTGFGFADEGAKAAGYEIIGGMEYDAAIADVSRANGHPVVTMDILKANPKRFDRPDHYHASPPCPNFSVAKQGRGETQHDIDLAEAVCKFLTIWKPRTFTLENVPAYVRSESFARITKTLERLGYFYHFENLNAADFGVPQTRNRLWLRAVHGGFLPHLPAPVAWVGWYQAIEDLIDTLPDSQFAQWQLDRLPAELTTFIMQVQGEGGDGLRDALEPMQTIGATHGANKYRAFLVDSAGYPDETGATVPVTRQECEPANTIVSNLAKRPMRAFIMSATEQRSAASLRLDDEPMRVLKSQDRMPRAFIMAGGVHPSPPAMGDDPIYTITASKAQHPSRALLINESSTMEIRVAAEPAATQLANGRNGGLGQRAWLSQGRVVSMTPRALARFQSVPDSYQLPDKKSLACKGIGNGVPPLLAEIIYRGLK